MASPMGRLGGASGAAHQIVGCGPSMSQVTVTALAPGAVDSLTLSGAAQAADMLSHVDAQQHPPCPLSEEIAPVTAGAIAADTTAG